MPISKRFFTEIDLIYRNIRNALCGAVVQSLFFARAFLSRQLRFASTARITRRRQCNGDNRGSRYRAGQLVVGPTNVLGNGNCKSARESLNIGRTTTLYSYIPTWVVHVCNCNLC